MICNTSRFLIHINMENMLNSIICFLSYYFYNGKQILWFLLFDFTYLTQFFFIEWSINKVIKLMKKCKQYIIKNIFLIFSSIFIEQNNKKKLS